MRIDEYFAKAIAKCEQESKPQTRQPITPKLAAQLPAMRKSHRSKKMRCLHVYDVEPLFSEG